MNNLSQTIEAIVFAAEQPVTIPDIYQVLAQIFEEEKDQINNQLIEDEILALQKKYEQEEFSMHIVKIAGGYQFLTKADYHEAVSVLLQQKAKKRLSTAALETLAIIAYKQPITKAEIEHIRGVNSDYSVQKLLEKDLIEISGKSEGPGKPVLYSTSKTFMDYFGINSVKDLPQLRDLYVQQNTIGQQNE